ncbi:TRAP transporter small permease [Phaeobacter italicus]|uniref:TRAP transporter small permease n=1 Tax=Phaeobacter italicus TaxID=481446 RepID=UPI00242AF552|nr:TRAP transporter small permease [Phaeobacter italicus]MCI5102126.1 TRAP transporter small permease [Phaeobacter italicus]
MKRFLSALLTVETLVAGAFYAIAAAILFADVISREFLNSPIWGGQRIAVLLANGSALIGIAVAVALNRHIRPSVLDGAIPARFDPVTLRAGHFVGASVMFAAAYFAAMLVLENRAMGFTTPPLKLEIWIAQLALPYGFASAGLRYLFFAIDPSLQPKHEDRI